jgi:hypothetical protein
MKLPNAVYQARPWRIHEIACDFTLEDVWAFPSTAAQTTSNGARCHVLTRLSEPDVAPDAFLWGARDLLGRPSASAGFRLRRTARGTVPQGNCRFRGRGNPR